MYQFWNYRKNETFGIRLKKLRKLSNLSQTQLAKDLCVSRSCISNYERGFRYPDYDMIKRIAEYFGIFIDYLAVTSDLQEFPIEKDKMSEYNEILNIIDCYEDKIDISGIPVNKKIAIAEYVKFIIGSDEII